MIDMEDGERTASLPSRGRGLKAINRESYTARALSLPSRGRGLKVIFGCGTEKVGGRSLRSLRGGVD